MFMLYAMKNFPNMRAQHAFTVASALVSFFLGTMLVIAGLSTSLQFEGYIFDLGTLIFLVGLLLGVASVGILLRRNWGRRLHILVLWLAISIGAIFGLAPILLVFFLSPNFLELIDSPRGELMFYMSLGVLLAHGVLSTRHLVNTEIKSQFK